MNQTPKIKTEWELSRLLTSLDDPRFKTDCDEVLSQAKEFATKWRNNEEYLHNPATLRLALEEYETYLTKYAYGGRSGLYFYLLGESENNNAKVTAKNNLVKENWIKAYNEIQFFQLNIGKIPQEKQKEFLDSVDLANYKHFLEKVFALAKYNLSEKEEKIINLKLGSSLDSWIKMTSTFLSQTEMWVINEKGEKIKETEPGILTLLSSPNVEVRKSAASAFNKLMKMFVEVAENELNAILATKKIDDELRGYLRPDASRLLEDDIEVEVVDAMIESVAANFHLAHRYYTFKAKLLGQKKLKYYERSVSFGKLPSGFDFEKAVKLVSEVFANLDQKFNDIFWEKISGGFVDVYPKKGKTGGAFNVCLTTTTPAYVMLNHTGSLQDVTTLAHEFGHTINDELTRKNQNEVNFQMTLATAEVASTFMEDFVFQKLLEDADEETKLDILIKKLDDDVASVFRQVACYRFEQELHARFRKEGYLSKETIGTIFLKHMSSYMGKSLDMSKGSENWWVYWGHIRRFFYVYSYASGLLISKSLQAEVKKDPKFVEKVKEFLSAGTSDSPKNIFAKMGIDITDSNFWNKGLMEIEESLNEAETLAKKLGKIT